MFKFAGVSVVALIVASSPAYAGEEVRYEAAPAWVQVAEIDTATMEDGPSEVLFDWQHRLESGTVQTYGDRAVRIDNLQALTSEGTLQMDWAPDKGDLIIHRFEILRDGVVIDLIADGVKFEILRREEGLNRRLLDGRLTATIAVPGLEEGDVLRVAHSISVDDQALGQEMQALQYLPPEPYRVGMGRVIMSWPEGTDIGWRAGPRVDLSAPVAKNGYQYLTVNFPIAKREDMPSDAPSRFTAAPVLRVGSFGSWQELSKVMEPHFTKASQIPDDGKVAKQAASIMRRTSDPLKRTELAVRLVQDQVSYLLDGLDGGNYLPQAAELTWEKRYGDCKAKSVLLLSILRQMGIESDVVLVTTQEGDALPELLPMPANFDHMIVRATVNGTDYWLDGTSTATRISNMAAIPPFFYALPLTAEGSDLTPISDRSQAHPDMAINIIFDHSAGVDLPNTYEMRMDLSGPSGASFRAIVDEGDPESDKQMMRQFSGGPGGGSQVTSIKITYDDEKAIGTILVKGVSDPMFAFNQGRMELSLGDESASATFSPNRARPKWRTIPVITYGPGRNHAATTIKLPDGGKGFTLNGTEQLDERYANTRIIRKSSLGGGSASVQTQQIADLGEVAVSDLAAARRAALRIAKADLTLRAPADAVWRWELSKDELASRTKEALAGYNAAVEQADDDDFGPLQARAQYFGLVYDFQNALQDYDTVIDVEPTEYLYLARAQLYESLGRLDDAIDDIEAAYELSPENETAYYQAKLMARAGMADKALELLDLLPVSENEMDGMVDARAIALGLSGNVDSGLAILAERLGERTDSSNLLNADCWYRGLHKVALEDAVALCTRAVERASYPAGVLDSRAMVHFRRGDLGSALVDANAAFKLAPGLSATRYLRGIILLEQGDKSGRSLVESALRQSPELKDHYALYGIAPRL